MHRIKRRQLHHPVGATGEAFQQTVQFHVVTFQHLQPIRKPRIGCLQLGHGRMPAIAPLSTGTSFGASLSLLSLP